MSDFYDKVRAERERQEAKWGHQRHPLPEPGKYHTYAEQAGVYKGLNDARADAGQKAGWDTILLEEVCELLEAIENGDLQSARVEAVQVAAVVKAIDEHVAELLDVLDEATKCGHWVGPRFGGDSEQGIHKCELPAKHDGRCE